MNWPVEVLKTASEIKSRTAKTDWAGIAETIMEQYDITVPSVEALRGAVRRFELKGYTEVPPAITEPLPALPEPTGRRFDNVLTLPANTNALCIGDLHGDLYNRDLLVRAIKEAREFDVDTIIIGGDLFNADELSTHPHNEKFTPFHKEMEIVGQILEYLGNLPEIDTICVTSGNHDERVTKKLNSYLSHQMVINAALNGRKVKADILVTDLDYCYLNNSWVIGHLSNYNKIGGKLALDVGKLHKRHAAVFHDHQQGIVADTYIGVSVGCMLQRDAFFYKERRLNTFKNFQCGFLIIADNAPYLYTEYGQHAINGGKTWKELDNETMR